MHSDKTKANIIDQAYTKPNPTVNCKDCILVCMCTSMCTTVSCTTAQSRRSDGLPSLPVCWKSGGYIVHCDIAGVCLSVCLQGSSTVSCSPGAATFTMDTTSSSSWPASSSAHPPSSTSSALNHVTNDQQWSGIVDTIQYINVRTWVSFQTSRMILLNLIRLNSGPVFPQQINLPLI